MAETEIDIINERLADLEHAVHVALEGRDQLISMLWEKINGSVDALAEAHNNLARGVVELQETRNG